MNRSAVAIFLASVCLIMWTDPAPAGSGIGKGDPSESSPGPLEPQDAAPASAEPDAAAQSTAPGGAQQETGAFDNTPSAEQTASGIVGVIHRDAMNFTCRCGAGEQTFATTAGTTFRKGGAAAGFSDIAPGLSVTLKFHSEDGASVVDAVDISP